MSAVGRAPAFAVAECAGLFGAPGHRCSVPFDPEVFAQDLRTITLRGLLLVIPAALLGAGIGALAGRRPALRQGTARTGGSRREPAWAPGAVLAVLVVLVVLAVADLAAVVLALPADHAVWTASAGKRSGAVPRTATRNSSILCSSSSGAMVLTPGSAAINAAMSTASRW
ncbi:hypothetical protein [Streptomyces longispororuber]|uniref:hypothetical protein n=1 Tax=Streptomyces longispororuber TaxID=68230 RepID=UPI003F5506A0